MMIVMEFLQFAKERKKLWLLPLFILALALGGLLILSQATALSPFIYSLF
jgi:hypothetical protein